MPFNFSIPRDKNYPPQAVQCDGCGGYGCGMCDQRGWFSNPGHILGRRCLYDQCRKPLAPDHVAVYCSNECTQNDA